MSKIDRQKIYDKYGGLCAYTGHPLDEKWQVDHIEPKFFYRMFLIERDCNHESNLAPAIRIVNHYKIEKGLAEFRKYMLTFHERIAKLPKNPLVEKSKKRKAYMLEVARLFDITPEKPFNGKFYFETLNNQLNEQ